MGLPAFFVAEYARFVRKSKRCDLAREIRPLRLYYLDSCATAAQAGG